jgi:2-polyprenyl-6-methoxyphenol hydroxylase-like FAD-dependent oxidoreductase
MMRRVDTRVLVVGGGPVGLSLAMDLAWRGIAVVVAELRHRGEAPSVKCNHVAARTIENVSPSRRRRFRPRCWLTARLPQRRRLPPHHHRDRSSRASGSPVAPIRYTTTDGPDTRWPTPEPPHQINQIYLEPILFAHAEAMAGCAILAPRSACRLARRCGATGYDE